MDSLCSRKSAFSACSSSRRASSRCRSACFWHAALRACSRPSGGAPCACSAMPRALSSAMAILVLSHICCKLEALEASPTGMSAGAAPVLTTLTSRRPLAPLWFTLNRPLPLASFTLNRLLRFTSVPSLSSATTREAPTSSRRLSTRNLRFSSLRSSAWQGSPSVQSDGPRHLFTKSSRKPLCASGPARPISGARRPARPARPPSPPGADLDAGTFSSFSIFNDDACEGILAPDILKLVRFLPPAELIAMRNGEPESRVDAVFLQRTTEGLQIEADS
mmetsp:Transcript_12654/g.27326  ORF Transcript_12654/g.27326 Transcript_12654/m.27326 type:complete len:277 (+) Transcript_12654:59-889(+)